MKKGFLTGLINRASKNFCRSRLLLVLAIFLGWFTAQAQGQHQTAVTKYIHVNGHKFAYRTFGQANGTPLVFLQHFTGTMDNWDPALTDGFAKTRPVILFDNKGVGSSEDEAPSTIKEMSEDAVAFIQALGHKQVDLIGFSLGGFVAQQLTADHPEVVRKLILAGTGPQGVEVMDNTPVIENRDNKTPEQMLLYLFFDPSTTSQEAGKAFFKRITTRQQNRDQNTKVPSILAQNQAIVSFTSDKDATHALLKKIDKPVLIVNGIRDIMVPATNSFIMATHIANAKLILYPDSGHGAIFQYHEDFTNQANSFLNQKN